MNKGFYPYRRIISDIPDLLKVQFPAENDCLQSHFLEFFHIIQTVGCQLCGGMDRQIRKMIPYQTDGSEILHDQPVHTHDAE